MKKELSILIPVYNYDCTSLVQGLCRQLDLLARQEEVCAEIVVAEDGSTDEAAIAPNRQIAQWPSCRYMERKANVGRAAIRNFLAQMARYDWLLFLDCDMQLPGEDFLKRYLQSEGTDIIDGGFGVVRNDQLNGKNLRYTYEWCEQERHGVDQRRNNPYRSFRTTNFMIRRDIMLAHPFDERFRHYGYEDVLFGKTMKQNGVRIEHIDNPMMLEDVESNEVFMAKTEEAMRTLHDKRQLLRGYSQLLTVVDDIHIAPVRWLIRLWHWLFGRLERRNLCGRHPSLRIFKLYKLGYFLSITNKQ